MVSSRRLYIATVHTRTNDDVVNHWKGSAGTLAADENVVMEALGAGLDWDKLRHFTKVSLYLNFVLKSLQTEKTMGRDMNSSYAILMDSDTLWSQPSLSSLWERFDNVRGNRSIVVSSETGCWMGRFCFPQDVAEYYSNTPVGPSVFVNSGGIVGSLPALKIMFQNISDGFSTTYRAMIWGDREKKLVSGFRDQYAVTVWSKEHPELVAIDYSQAIFGALLATLPTADTRQHGRAVCKHENGIINATCGFEEPYDLTLDPRSCQVSRSVNASVLARHGATTFAALGSATPTPIVMHALGPSKAIGAVFRKGVFDCVQHRQTGRDPSEFVFDPVASAAAALKTVTAKKPDAASGRFLYVGGFRNRDDPDILALAWKVSSSSFRGRVSVSVAHGAVKRREPQPYLDYVVSAMQAEEQAGRDISKAYAMLVDVTTAFTEHSVDKIWSTFDSVRQNRSIVIASETGCWKGAGELCKATGRGRIDGPGPSVFAFPGALMGSLLALERLFLDIAEVKRSDSSVDASLNVWTGTAGPVAVLDHAQVLFGELSMAAFTSAQTDKSGVGCKGPDGSYSTLCSVAPMYKVERPGRRSCRLTRTIVTFRQCRKFGFGKSVCNNLKRFSAHQPQVLFSRLEEVDLRNAIQLQTGCIEASRRARKGSKMASNGPDRGAVVAYTVSEVPFRMSDLQTYMINMDTRPQRFAHTYLQLRELGLPFKRFSAVKGDLIETYDRDREHGTATVRPNLQVFPETKFDIAQYNSTVHSPGSVACWLSHMQVYMDVVRQAAAGNHSGPVLILEDDLVIETDLRHRLEAVMSTLPHDWELVFVGSCWAQCWGGREHTHEWCRVNRVLCGDGYMLRNATVAQKMVDAANTEHVQISDWIWKDIVRTSLRTYALFPRQPLIQQDKKGFGSDAVWYPPLKLKRDHPLTVLRAEVDRVVEGITATGQYPTVLGEADTGTGSVSLVITRIIGNDMYPLQACKYSSRFAYLRCLSVYVIEHSHLSPVDGQMRSNLAYILAHEHADPSRVRKRWVLNRIWNQTEFAAIYDLLVSAGECFVWLCLCVLLCVSVNAN